MPENLALSSIARHGAARLPSVEVESYNVEIKDDDGFVGDRACKGAFRDIVEKWRKPLRDIDQDPFGDEPSPTISRKRLDTLLADGDPEAAGVVQGAIEDYAQALAAVIRRFLKLKNWRSTERIVVGGGFRGSRVGELAIGRTSVVLKADQITIDVAMIRNEPDHAGLIGAAHLAPRWMFKAHDAILGVDIGGSNIRAGIVELNLDKAPDLSKARVTRFELWRHQDERKLNRDDAVEGLIDMLERLIVRAGKDGLALAPFIGVGCPGKIDHDGAIECGAQNLPGNWESRKFNLPAALFAAIPKIGGDETAVVMHNDAVVQGLSEAPFMGDVGRWAVFTIGTGLGNALFVNRKQT